MLGKTRWLALTLVVALTTVAVGVTATADSGSENGFLSAINSTRSSAGLGSLTMHGGLQSHARSHSAYMADGKCPDDKPICHSSSNALQSAAGSGWTKLGENVGRGGDVSGLHKAFLNSPSHKANIHGDYTHVGIGTTSKDGFLYVTVVFMKKGETTTTTTAPPATTTTSAAATATPTTAPAKSGGSKSSKPVTKPAADSAPAATTTTTTLPPTTTTTTLVVPPDKPVTPGESCYTVTRFWWMCHD